MSPGGPAPPALLCAADARSRLHNLSRIHQTERIARTSAIFAAGRVLPEK